MSHCLSWVLEPGGGASEGSEWGAEENLGGPARKNGERLGAKLKTDVPTFPNRGVCTAQVEETEVRQTSCTSLPLRHLPASVRTNRAQREDVFV